MKEQYYTELEILSENLAPDNINSILGMTCDKSWSIGEVIKPSSRRAKKNICDYYSRIEQDAPLEDHIKDLLERVSPIIGKIKSLSIQPGIDVWFNCVVHTNTRPAIFFTNEQISTINAMNANLDVDLYWIPNNEDK